MMNKEQFLESGLLEQYALGLTTEKETAIVEEFMEKHPEIRKEVQEMQRALEDYAAQYSTPPPDELKEKILTDIEQTAVQHRLPDQMDRRNQRLFTSLSLVGFVLMSLWSIYRGQEVRQLESEVVSAKMDYQSLKADCETNKLLLQEHQAQIAFFQSGATQAVRLVGVALATGTGATVYWNPETKKALVNLGSLPEPPPGKVYQLWADVDHVMVSSGVLDFKHTDFQEVQFIADAASLNITLEPQGGSREATVSMLQA
ncbi:MAG: anti-sigma factor, partial [Phaeodactylibacter sp.]|nr:anti-sigma factor [Phaeodactylibacter sp.]